jgi:hypothetical protein
MTQRKELEVAVGYLLYYGRCVDGRVLLATCALASALTNATLNTMVDLERLLGFVAMYPNGMKVFRPSSMILDVFTDASYLSRPKASPTQCCRLISPPRASKRPRLLQCSYLRPFYAHSRHVLLRAGGRACRHLCRRQNRGRGVASPLGFWLPPAAHDDTLRQ